ncbi:MAG: LysR family transcriptional regulator [Sphingomonadales bacterium]|nr:LysR family transcriptional regulator [Sphingomonadales bacterium]
MKGAAMEIRRLSYFVRIAEDGSLTKAAGILRVAQSALSRQMRLLEEELGVALFSRTARGMRLTDEGEYLQSAVAGPLREVELALQNIRSLPSLVEANFAIGMPPGLADILARPLALGLAEAFPNMEFRLVEGPTGGLVDWLNRGMVDFALLEETARNDQIQERSLASLPLALAGLPDGPLPRGAPVTLDKALKLPLILPSHHMGIRGAVNDALARRGGKANIRLQADASRLARELAKEGMGYAVLPECYFRQELSEGTLCAWPIADPALAIAVSLASRKGHQTARRQFSVVEDAIARMAHAAIDAVP